MMAVKLLLVWTICYLSLFEIVAGAVGTCVQKPFNCELLKQKDCATGSDDYCEWNDDKYSCLKKVNPTTNAPLNFPVNVFKCTGITNGLLCDSGPHQVRYTERKNGYYAYDVCEWQINEDVMHYQIQKDNQKQITDTTQNVKYPYEVFEKLGKGGQFGYIKIKNLKALSHIGSKEVHKENPAHISYEISYARMSTTEDNNGKIDSLVPVESRSWKKEYTVPYARVGAQAILNDENIYVSCTGTLIGRKWVATAAHCVSKAYDGGSYQGLIYPVETYRFWPGLNVELDQYSPINPPAALADGKKAVAIYVPHKWITTDFISDDQAAIYDIAFIELEEDPHVKGTNFGYGYFPNDVLLNAENHYMTIGYPSDLGAKRTPFIQYKSRAQVDKIQKGIAHYTEKYDVVLYDHKYLTYGGQSGSCLFLWKPKKVGWSQYIIVGILSNTYTKTGGAWANKYPNSVVGIQIFTRFTRITPFRFYLLRYLINNDMKLGAEVVIFNPQNNAKTVNFNNDYLGYYYKDDNYYNEDYQGNIEYGYDHHNIFGDGMNSSIYEFRYQSVFYLCILVLILLIILTIVCGICIGYIAYKSYKNYHQ